MFYFLGCTRGMLDFRVVCFLLWCIIWVVTFCIVGWFAVRGFPECCFCFYLFASDFCFDGFAYSGLGICCDVVAFV